MEIDSGDKSQIPICAGSSNNKNTLQCVSNHVLLWVKNILNMKNGPKCVIIEKFALLGLLKHFEIFTRSFFDQNFDYLEGKKNYQNLSRVF